jgi:nucleotide-binding universal stress UspA family protein
MATFLLGSTAAALSRHATCAVMIVRSPLRAHFV